MGLKLNLGCGRACLPGWVNVDVTALPGVDVVADLERCRTQRLPFADGAVDEFLLSHVLEHIEDTLGIMQELHRIARPGATATIRSPYGGSDDADEDPTHRHRFFLNSFGYSPNRSTGAPTMAIAAPGRRAGSLSTSIVR